jgi:dienelactone hydrolase
MSAHGHSHDGAQCHGHGAPAAAAAPAAAEDPHKNCVEGSFDAPLAVPLVPCTLDGVACLTAPCAGSAHPRAAVVICTDIFGPQLPNVQRLAQDLAAAAGVEVYIPDLCLGEALPTDFERSTLGAWFGRHGDAETVPVLARALRALRAGGKERILTLGFCWGARYAVLAAHGPHPLVDAWGVAHPTKTSPADFAGAVPVPGLLLLAETDGMFPPEALAETRALLEGKGEYDFQGPFAGTAHGFVVRGDEAVPAVAAGRAAARAAAAAFAQRQLAAWAKEGPRPPSAYGAGCEEAAHGHSHGSSSSSGGGHSHVRL